MELDIRRCLEYPKVKAVGEIGLDCQSESLPDDDIQIKAFILQIQSAREKKLLVVIYSRKIFIEVLNILCK
ncbi:unnamed protein product, partial [Rotaria socialis]